MSDRADRRLAIVALVFTLVVWGSAFVGLRACLRVLSPGHLVLLRFVAASLTFAVIAPPWRIRPPARSDLWIVAILGLLGTSVYHVCLNYGLVTLTAGAGSMVTNTAPVYATLLAAIVLKERVSALAWVGLAVSLIGVALISVGEGSGLHLAPGTWLVVAAAMAWGLHIVVQKPVLARCSPLRLSAYSVWFGSVPLLVFAPGAWDAVRAAPPSVLLWVIYLGIVPVGAAYATWSFVLSRMDASSASRYLFLIPVIATAVGWVVLDETPSGLSLLGGAIAIAGVALGSTRPGRRQTPIEPATGG